MDFESAPHDIFMNGGLLTIIAHLPAFLIPTMDFAIFQLENSKKGQNKVRLTALSITIFYIEYSELTV